MRLISVGSLLMLAAACSSTPLGRPDAPGTSRHAALGSEPTRDTRTNSHSRAALHERVRIDSTKRNPSTRIDAGPGDAPFETHEKFPTETSVAPNPPAKAMVNADACPEPLNASERPQLQAYEIFMNRALGLPPRPDELLVIRTSPSFEPDRTLTLIRRPNGRYFLRAIVLKENVWQMMMSEMERQQGSVIRLDEAFQAAALARVTTSKVIRERQLDGRTAHLLLQLWRSLSARAQVVREVGIESIKLDGVAYDVWHGGRAVSTHSPEAGSVLEEAVSSAQRLEWFVEDSSADAQADLAMIREQMRNALERTRRGEPCLRPYRATD